jgi:hypothetical protein
MSSAQDIGGNQNSANRYQSTVCTLAILLSKQVGILKNLAPFDATKARKCASTTTTSKATGDIWLIS